MNIKLISAFVLAGTALASQVASAADGTINFTGSVTANTCTIKGGASGTKDFTVALPAVSTTALAAASQTAGRTPFSIELTNCTGDSGNVHAYFEPGATTDLATGNLKVDAGGATNVQIGLLNADFSAIKAGFADASQNSTAVEIASGSASLPFYAQYVATGVATAGAANSSVQYTLSYE